MANEIEKLNNVALTSIEKLNGFTDANIQELNGLEWTGLTTGTWSEAGNMSTGRSRMGNIGTVYTAMLFAAGNEDDPVSAANYLSSSEEWNGSSTSTTSGGALGSPRQSLSAGGSQTAGFVAGGLIASGGSASETDTAENYNGSAWSSSNAMSQAKEAAKGGGTQTSHWLWGGYSETEGGYVDIMEIYNGSSWSSSTKALPNSEGARAYGMGGGLSDSTGVYTGGYSGPVLNGTFTWDGSSWTQPSGSNLSDARNAVQGGGHQTSMVISGGKHWTDASRLDTTELWDGSTWSSGGTASTSTFACGTSGSFTNGNTQVGCAGGTRVNHDGLTTIQFYDRT